MKGKILIIEDEAGIVLALEDRFKGEGYEVESARDGISGEKKALEGQQDILTPMAKQRDRVYRDLICPSCGEQEWKLEDKGPRDDEPVPWHHFRCKVCGCLYDPKTDLVLKSGNPPTSMVNPETE